MASTAEAGTCTTTNDATVQETVIEVVDQEKASAIDEEWTGIGNEPEDQGQILKDFEKLFKNA